MRGRIATRASLWIGVPFLSIRISTIADSSPACMWSTFVTLPTLTPAIRTSDPGLMLLAVLNAALTV